jgi:hypothetical protein
MIGFPQEVKRLLCLGGLAFLSLGIGGLRADPPSGPNLLAGSFEYGDTSYNPWAGVDLQGNLHVWEGTQFAVNDDGAVRKTSFSPSVGVGDLNGDGLPDLVVGDARGFFWFFPNSGKPNAPAFTHAELMPIWLETQPNHYDVVPRIQLIDFDGDGKLDIVAGNYAGQLYFLHNHGSATEPAFSIPDDRTTVQIPTHSDNLLWCNFLSPFLYDWSGTGRLDLLMGDGSYSANSIFLFTNQGSNFRPIFKENQMVKLIPGMGREHLTPQVVDWNNDGKPDIISGERAGYINLYLNQAATKTDPPVFDKLNPQHVSFGTMDKIGALTTVCVADLNHDNHFDLVISNTDGSILYSLNTGTPGAPKFGTPVPFKGTNPYPKIIVPSTWTVSEKYPRFHPYGAPNELLECTNAQVEKGFTPPPGFSGKGALKFSMVVPQNKYFKNFYYPQLVTDPKDPDELKRSMQYTGPVTLNTDTRYHITFWVRAIGNISDLVWYVHGEQDGEVYIRQNGDSVDAGGDWNKVTQRVEIPTSTLKKNDPVDFDFGFSWNGDGTLYFDDFSLTKDPP